MYNHEYTSSLLLDVFHPAVRANCILHRYAWSFFRTFDTGIRKHACRRIRYLFSSTIHSLYGSFWSPGTPFLSALAHEAARVFLDPSRLFRGGIAGCSRFLSSGYALFRHSLAFCFSNQPSYQLFRPVVPYGVLRNIFYYYFKNIPLSRHVYLRSFHVETINFLHKNTTAHFFTSSSPRINAEYYYDRNDTSPISLAALGHHCLLLACRNLRHPSGNREPQNAFVPVEMASATPNVRRTLVFPLGNGHCLAYPACGTRGMRNRLDTDAGSTFRFFVAMLRLFVWSLSGNRDTRGSVLPHPCIVSPPKTVLPVVNCPLPLPILSSQLCLSERASSSHAFRAGGLRLHPVSVPEALCA